MATKASVFVPQAVEKCRAIKNALITLQSIAEALRGEFMSLGGNNMDGINELDFSNYPFTKEEFLAAMLDVAAAHNAIALTTIYTLLGFDDVTKIAVG